MGWERSNLAGKYCLSFDDEAEVAAVSLFAWSMWMLTLSLEVLLSLSLSVEAVLEVDDFLVRKSLGLSLLE